MFCNKKVFLEILQNSQENVCEWDLNKCFPSGPIIRGKERKIKWKFWAQDEHWKSTCAFVCYKKLFVAGKPVNISTQFVDNKRKLLKEKFLKNS